MERLDPMRMTEVLAAEWKPALGCTEPAAVAWAAALAAGQAEIQGSGQVRQIRLVCDPRTYKNCYAVGLPNSNHAAGILWALALGSYLSDRSLELRSFEGVSAATVQAAELLLEQRGVHVEVDGQQPSLLVDVTVVGERGVGRAVLEQEHTHLVRLEKNGGLVGGAQAGGQIPVAPDLREEVARLSIQELMEMAHALSPEDRECLRRGAGLNLTIAQHGLSLLPDRFVSPLGHDTQSRLAHLVAAGVFARMSGESMMVMTLSGSGNKGITAAVPVTLWGRELGLPEARIEEALAFACLMTSAATWHLGTLSAICGAANAAGIGVASALVLMEGGSAHQVGLAVSNMVGNVAGMICDGAKIGCALKTMTGVDAAFRAASLALAGIGIPPTDGIVGEDGEGSLVNLGRLAQQGMTDVDTEILRIMQGKLRKA
jgi:L-cysteine desulfidase